MNSGLSSAQIMEFKARFQAWWGFSIIDVLQFECGGFCVCLF